MAHRLVPPGWGGDSLSEFLEHAHNNRYASFVHKREWYGRLSEIDGCFATISRDWMNPQNEISAFLFIRAHGAYRAACGMALAGQVVETFVLLRSTLEAAGYALHIHKNDEFASKWLKRHEDEAGMRLQKKAFEMRLVKQTIVTADRAAGPRFDALYQRTIDHGAHPNVFSIMGNALVANDADGLTAQHVLLHGEGLALEHALKSTAQVGICALDVLQCAFGARFELLGIRHLMTELRRGL